LPLPAFIGPRGGAEADEGRDGHGRDCTRGRGWREIASYCEPSVDAIRSPAVSREEDLMTAEGSGDWDGPGSVEPGSS
jgi:hypothetical protein